MANSTDPTNTGMTVDQEHSSGAGANLDPSAEELSLLESQQQQKARSATIDQPDRCDFGSCYTEIALSAFNEEVRQYQFGRASQNGTAGDGTEMKLIPKKRSCYEEIVLSALNEEARQYYQFESNGTAGGGTEIKLIPKKRSCYEEIALSAFFGGGVNGGTPGSNVGGGGGGSQTAGPSSVHSQSGGGGGGQQQSQQQQSSSMGDGAMEFHQSSEEISKIKASLMDQQQ
ncbi:hypothetical protein GPALN_004453 [Globodera pallida]|nr:hypothetical protein GPALN_004453 [Globodera pallida]